jgi:hypothetical protein
MCSIGGHNCIQLNANPSNLSQPCDLTLTPSSRLIWHRSLSSMSTDEQNMRCQYYFFTRLTMCLNERLPSDSLPPTDCRFRQDIRFLEEGNLDAASAEKNRLEEQQRAEARARQGEFRPLWFEKANNGLYMYTSKYDRRNFDRCPNLFSQSSAS